MKQQKANKMPFNKTREKKLQKNMFAIIAGLAVINLAVYYFEPIMIGHNISYTIYFGGIPVALGIAVIGYYRRIFLSNYYSECKTTGDKIFCTGFFLVQGIFFSYLTFGLLGNITWVYLNKKAAENNRTETITCRVTKFSHTKSRDRIYFTYLDKKEHLNISYQLYSDVKNDDPKNYEVEIEGRKGLWNYFVVKDWSLTNTGNGN